MFLESVEARSQAGMTVSSAKEHAVAHQYIEWLHISHLRFDVTFQTSSAPPRKGKKVVVWFSSVNPFMNVERMPLLLPVIDVYKYRSESFGALASQVTSEYSLAVAPNVLGMLGSMQILGNPVGILRGVGSGVEGFVHKTFSRDPLGLAKGTFQLISKPITGVTDSAAGVLNATSGVFARMADRKYQEQRARQKAEEEEKNTNIATGAMYGAKHIGKGIFSGITGLVKEPVKGAKKGGFFGGMKSFGKAVVGVVAKPVSGVVDAGSAIVQGTGRMLDDTKAVKRIKPVASSAHKIPFMRAPSLNEDVSSAMTSQYPPGKVPDAFHGDN